MSKRSATVTIEFTKDGKNFNRTFSGMDVTEITDKDTAKTSFINKYKGIVDGTPVSYDYSQVEKDIEY